MGLAVFLLWLCGVAPALCALQLTTCALNDCAPVLTLSGPLNSGDAATVVLRAGDELLDQYGRPWVVARAATVAVASSTLVVDLQLVPTGETVQTAYETVRVRNPLESCPLWTQCCVDAAGVHQVRALLVNATVYDLYTFVIGSAPARIDVNITIDNVVASSSSSSSSSSSTAVVWRAISQWEDHSSDTRVVRSVLLICFLLARSFTLTHTRTR